MANGSEDAAPLAECDIIMRGGITSGLVYPGVLSTLAEKYRFRNIGGASAGAIAAGVAAAAEYGRQNSPDQKPFKNIVSQIPAKIGGAEVGEGGTSMRQLFQAHGRMRPLAGLLWWALGKPSAIPIGLMALLWLAVCGWITASVLAPVIGILATASGGSIATSVGGHAWWALAAIAAAAGGLVGLVLLSALIATGLSALRGNGFGLATGVNPALAGSNDVKAYRTQGGFADWMHATIQDAANRKVDRHPLVMRDLWGTDDLLARDRKIDLILTTTNLSQQLSHRFPFLERSRSFLYFVEADLRKVLPTPVVDYLVALQTGDPNDITDGRHKLYNGTFTLKVGPTTYYRMPMACDMPVILGVRLSLSFPLLISAVKLYETVSWRPDEESTYEENLDDQDYAARHIKPCWFSDGGITSNFPVNSFDALLPTRPTFCVNLADLPEGADPKTFERVQINVKNSEAIRGEHLANLDRSGLRGFLGAIVAAARNAHENELVTMPGQRDRIVTIYLNPKKEGGLNLAMSAGTIGKLDQYGREAAGKLICRFGGPIEGGDEKLTRGWENHRWVRMRTAFAALERLLAGFNAQWSKPHAYDQKSYQQLIREANAKLPSYRWPTDDQAKRAAEAAGDIAALAAKIEAMTTGRPNDSIFDGVRNNPGQIGSVSRNRGAPRPVVNLALRPSGSDPRQ